ncbi:MAG: hypothetical protein ACD_24C00131G0002, partial [uncultured bacterium]
MSIVKYDYVCHYYALKKYLYQYLQMIRIFIQCYVFFSTTKSNTTNYFVTQ